MHTPVFPSQGFLGDWRRVWSAFKSAEAPQWETGTLSSLWLSPRRGIEPGFVGSHDITALLDVNARCATTADQKKINGFSPQN
ncbi:hypothetical protein LXL04_032933 [Taraxacum kok-saghyz]